jgi:hypothetical protein
MRPSLLNENARALQYPFTQSEPKYSFMKTSGVRGTDDP